MSSMSLRRSMPPPSILRQTLRAGKTRLPLSRCAVSLSRGNATTTRSAAALPTRRMLFTAPTRQFSLSRRCYDEQTVKVPEMAESITEGTLKGWSKSEGDYVELDEEMGSIETDKIDVAINAPFAGTIKKFLAKEEDTVEVGQDLILMEAGGEPGEKAPKAKEEPKQEATESQETPSQSQGGPEPKADAPKQESQSKPAKEESQPEAPKQQQQQQQQQQPPKAEPKKDDKKEFPYGAREERRVKMNRMRLRIAERLKQSQNTAASLTTFNEVDMSALMDMRKQYKDEILKKTGVKLGFMGAFAMASQLAMKEVPTVNASIEGPGGGDTIVYRDYVDISVAVATEKGLVTPVVRNAESLDMIGIEREIAMLGKKARENKLTIEDMAGGTFTISNGGVFGSLMGTPIINLPQTAVLGLHAIKDKAVVVDGNITIRPMMFLALTYDHRLLDGREAVIFLVRIKEYIEDPRKMLLVA